jgi:hypothetical protein
MLGRQAPWADKVLRLASLLNPSSAPGLNKKHKVPENAGSGTLRNGQAWVEALVELLMEPSGRRERQKLLVLAAG